MDHAVVAAAGARARRSLAREPDVAHAHAARARHVTRERVADEGRGAGLDAERRERVAEDARVRLLAADARGVHDGAEEPADARVLAHALEVPVEVRDDPEPVAPREPLEQRRVLAETLLRRGEEATRDSVGHGAVGDAERVRDGRHQAPDGVGERERRRQRADERVVGRVEDAVEALAGDDDARVREEVVDAILPGDPVGVEGSPEVEQHRSGVSVQAIVRVKLVEAVGIEPTSGNPQPQASTSIADLLYSVSSPGTPTDGIAPGPASLFSPLPRS